MSGPVLEFPDQLCPASFALGRADVGQEEVLFKPWEPDRFSLRQRCQSLAVRFVRVAERAHKDATVTTTLADFARLIGGK